MDEYYSHDGALDKYAALAEEGLFDQEKTVVDRYFTRDGASVLDLGCGAGRTTQALVSRGFDVVGVDVSEPMIRKSSSLFPDLEVRVGDATDLSFETSTFDYVLFSFNGLDDITPETGRYAALAEIRRVLKPGGTFAFSSRNSLYYTLLRARPFSPGTWVELAKFWAKNRSAKNALSNYKSDDHEFGSGDAYYSTPLHQKRQLINCDCEPVDVIKKEDSFSVYTDPWPYYVAKTL
ncbi:hypothetical protein JCM18750_32020 [Halostagnicola bangensis]